MLQVRRSVVHGLAVTGLVAAIAAVVWAGAGEWPGAAADCVAAGNCDCEDVRNGAVGQPINAASSVALVVVGLAVLARSDVYRPSRRDLILDLRVLGAAVVLAGVGSAALHITVTAWGAWLDGVAVDAVLLAILAVEARRLLGAGRPALLWLGSTALDALLRGILDGGGGRILTGVLVATVIVSQIASLRMRRRDLRLLWWASAAVAGGFLLRSLAADGAWCRPGSLLQGHAVWHLAAALGLLLVVSYVESEGAGAP